jgi:hypothetical protein
MVQRFKTEFQGTLRDLEVWEAPCVGGTCSY